MSRRAHPVIFTMFALKQVKAAKIVTSRCRSDVANWAHWMTSLNWQLAPFVTPSHHNLQNQATKQNKFYNYTLRTRESGALRDPRV